MDNLTYQYEKVINPNTQLPELDVNGKPIPKNNRLRYVHDQVNATNYTEDIDSQTPLSLSAVNSDINQAQTSDNYAYDAIGNLIKDKKEGITNISWTVYGKIGAISKTDPNTNLSTVINYTYDAAGNRITKTVQKDNELPVITYYVRDASGNVMSVYDNSSSSEASPITGTLTQKEIHLYGSDRLAIYNVKVQMEVDSRIYTSMAGTTNNQAELITFIRGNKFFELKNHLGNVLVTVSDKKLTELIYCDPAVDRNCTSGSLVGVYYKADVITATDYYPFGMQMQGRKYQASPTSKYRYGFSDMEKDDDIKGEGNQIAFEERIYDTRLGRWLSLDPLEDKYPSISPYVYCLNNPIKFIDVKGEFVVDPAFKLAYPTVALILENADKIYYHMELPDDVKKALNGVDYNKVFNDVFTTNFKEISTGSDDEIREMLTNGKGPLVQSYKEPNADDEEFSNGHTENNKDQKFINISPEIAGVLEFELNPGSNTNPQSGLGGVTPDEGDKQVAFKVFSATLFHEGVHWIRLPKGTNVNIPINGVPRDPGKVFEIKTFGRDQGRLRVKDLRKSTEKPRTEAQSDTNNYNSGSESEAKPKAKTQERKPKPKSNSKG